MNKNNGRQFALLFSATFLLANTAQAGESNLKTPFSGASQKPSDQDLIAATAPSYVTPTDMKSECLGRLIFDVKKPVHWPTWHNPRRRTMIETRIFSPNVFAAGDELVIGRVKVAVIGPLTPDIRKSLLSELPVNRINDLKKDVKNHKTYLDGLVKENASDKKSRYERSQAEEQVERLNKTIGELTEKFHSFDPGIPDSNGYSYTEEPTDDEKSSVFRAYLMGPAYAYVFESTEKFNTAKEIEIHRNSFIKTVRAFQPRKSNEIPTRLGVCIPYGFMPDDGNTVIDIKQTIRWADAPGVLYTIHTGDVDVHHIKTPVVDATASAAMGMFGSADESRMKPFITQRIGPRTVKIGALSAQQGGIVLRVTEAGKAPYEAYSVFTGNSGWLGSAVLPYILLEMNTRTLEQAPELKANPPPFKQSMDRLETLLRSTRIRPTNPVMPELAAAQRPR